MQRDGDFFYDFQSRDHDLLDDWHDESVADPAHVGRVIDEAVNAATTYVDTLTSERRIHDRSSALDACAHSNGPGASQTRADAQSLRGERNLYALRFA